jgi:hypothetical protein
MNKNNLSRRQFIAAASVGSLAAVTLKTIPAYSNLSKKASKLAILGGQPVRTKPWPSWPIWDKSGLKFYIGERHDPAFSSDFCVWLRFGSLRLPSLRHTPVHTEFTEKILH